MELIDRDVLLDWLQDERDVCLYHNNYDEASEAAYIRKHVMEMPRELGRTRNERFLLNIPGLQIGHVGSTASGDPWHCWQYTKLCDRCRSLCQDCANLEQGPATISENITISGESSYCTAPEVSQMQIVDGAVVKCSGYKRKELGGKP